MKKQDEFKTGFSMSIKIPTAQKLVEYAYKLQISKSEVARRIIEYFIEHNDVEDLAE